MSESGVMEQDPRAALLTEFGKLKRQHELRLQNPNPRYPAPKRVIPGKYAAGVYFHAQILPPEPQYDPLTYNSHLLTLLRMLRDDWLITIEQTMTTTATTITFSYNPPPPPESLDGKLHGNPLPMTSSPYPSLYDAVAGAVQYAVWYAKETDV